MSYGPISEKAQEFLTPRAAALLRMGSRKSYRTYYIVLLIFITFIAWTNITPIHEITKAPGKIIDSGHIQNINSLEGGIIKEILVQEDQVVHPEQVLIRLDTTIAQAKLTQNGKNYYRFLATEERLRAQINNASSLQLSQELILNDPILVSQEIERFETHRLRKKGDIRNAKNDLIMKQQELKETKIKLRDAKSQYRQTQKQIKITKPLAVKKIYPKIEYIKIVKDLEDQKAQYFSLKEACKRLTAGVNQAKDRIDQVTVRYRTDDLQELRDVQGKLIEIQASLVSDKDRMKHTDIRSPVTGTVRDLKVHTIGSTVQASESLLDVVPLNDTLLVETQVSPSDIGYLHPGMPATVKVTAYDYGTYGGLDAVIESISPDSITDRKEQSYFRVLLRTKSTILMKDGIFHGILPGMQVEADILTGSKTVFKYLMKPFMRALNESMTER